MKKKRFLLTIVGKKRLVRNVLKVNASVNVPTKSTADRRKTSGTASVICGSPQAMPVKFQPCLTHWSSLMQSLLTSIRFLYVRQFSSSSFRDMTELQTICRQFSYWFHFIYYIRNGWDTFLSKNASYRKPDRGSTGAVNFSSKFLWVDNKSLKFVSCSAANIYRLSWSPVNFVTIHSAFSTGPPSDINKVGGVVTHPTSVYRRPRTVWQHQHNSAVGCW